MQGEYGFYEAIDYTPSRVPRGSDYSIVRSYMVHHQGMSFLSLAHVLLNKPMQQRFESELRFNATLLLAAGTYTENYTFLCTYIRHH